MSAVNSWPFLFQRAEVYVFNTAWLAEKFGVQQILLMNFRHHSELIE